MLCLQHLEAAGHGRYSRNTCGMMKTVRVRLCCRRLINSLSPRSLCAGGWRTAPSYRRGPGSRGAPRERAASSGTGPSAPAPPSQLHCLSGSYPATYERKRATLRLDKLCDIKDSKQGIANNPNKNRKTVHPLGIACN